MSGTPLKLIVSHSQAGMQALLELTRRYPWAVALFGFASGVASFLLVDRQAGAARVLPLLLLLSWLLLVLENLLQRSISRWTGRELPPAALRYLTQLIHQESLFFVLPFFLITTSWNSAQLLFTGLLGLAALVSIIDPLYYRHLATRRWLFLAFHSLTLFVVLLTALPIILQLTTAESYRLALGSALLLSFASLYGSLRSQRGWRLSGLLLVPLLLAAGGWFGRAWVPPATLWITEMAISPALDTRQRLPAEPLRKISSTRLQAEGLYAYAAINAPRGLDEEILHVWRHAGREVDRIPLTIQGGRQAGYRAWSHKQNFPQASAGEWQVLIMTAGGQMIGSLGFSVYNPAGFDPEHDAAVHTR
jgi:hypothetical protein